MKKPYLIFSILFIALGTILITSYLINRTPKNTVLIKDKVFKVEIAKTESEREKGLMNRTSLASDSGMLFVFEKPQILTFWMKDTLIPLDIIWINTSTSLSTGKIVDFVTMEPPKDNIIPQYTSKKPADYVLELNAGAVKNSDIKIGDTVKINY